MAKNEGLGLAVVHGRVRDGRRKGGGGKEGGRVGREGENRQREGR
jgi:hypothetical protein